MKYLVYVFWLGILILGLSFSGLNPQVVRVHYYFGTALMALPFLLALTLVLGVVLGWLVTIPVWIKARYWARRYKQQLKQRTQELAALREELIAPVASRAPE